LISYEGLFSWVFTTFTIRKNHPLQQLISDNLKLDLKNVSAVVRLLNEGATIPFIARYRKEATGSLDEVAIEKIANEQQKLNDIEKRKQTIFERLKELNIDDRDLINKIKFCYNTTELEDLYLPYKPKRTTKASKAKALGLEPLAKVIMAQKNNNIDGEAQRYATNNLSKADALQGGRDIIAEWISESSIARNQLRKVYKQTALLTAKVVKKKEGEATKYKDYFNFAEQIKRIPSHRYLAISRAEREGLLRVKVEIDNDDALKILNNIFLKSWGNAAEQIKLAIADSLKRLLAPSLEGELRAKVKEKADDEAIEIFAKNLSQLLLAPPLGGKAVLAIDPGFRTGCKVACLNKQTNLVEHTTIFPHAPQNKTVIAEQTILKLADKHKINAIAIGNGTAGRETQQFVKKIVPAEMGIEIYLISESGASIYSASAVGREEFPDLDLTVRGAISIGRRLVDPLAELVKIEPKNIGVGQYQHDVDQGKLKSSLDNTVSFSVNKVGVNLNTASMHLMQFVAGVGPKLAQNIVDYRKQNGAFKSRSELKKVKGLGAKAFEQSAGFLRIKNGKNPLDKSAVHPESYGVVTSMAKRLNCKVEDLLNDGNLLKQLDLKNFVTPTIGLPTLNDIVAELNKPGLDPRGEAKAVKFNDAIREITDLKVNMTLTGKVTNLTKFGAFVDIGIKENGLLHISQITDRFIKDPSEVLSLDEEVQVKILSIDLERKRIQLSRKF